METVNVDDTKVACPLCKTGLINRASIPGTLACPNPECRLFCMDMTPDDWYKLIKPQDYTLLRYFYSVVSMGVVCGLQHPIEWYMNYSRRPQVIPFNNIGLRKESEEMSWEVLKLFFEFVHLRKPKDDTEVMDWMDAFYNKDKGKSA
jgi:hypothetical protein